MADKRGRPSSRATIIQSAIDLVKETGPASFTLDAVAEQAGLSKGGLLYHFRSKDELVMAMIEHALRAFEEDVDALAETQPPGPGRWLRAFVLTTFAAKPEHDPGVSLLAAAAIDLKLLEPVNTYFARWHARAVQDGCDPADATLVRLAADGLWFADIFTHVAPGGELREDVLHRLIGMIDASTTGEE